MDGLLFLQHIGLGASFLRRLIHTYTFICDILSVLTSEIVAMCANQEIPTKVKMLNNYKVIRVLFENF